MENLYLFMVGLFVFGPMLGIWPLKFTGKYSGVNNPFWFWLAPKEWFIERGLNRQATAAHEIFENWFPWMLGAIVAAPVYYFLGNWPAVGIMTLTMFLIRIQEDNFDLYGHSAEAYWVGTPEYLTAEAKRRGVSEYTLKRRFWFTRLVKLLTLRILLTPKT